MLEGAPPPLLLVAFAAGVVVSKTVEAACGWEAARVFSVAVAEPAGCEGAWLHPIIAVGMTNKKSSLTTIRSAVFFMPFLFLLVTIIRLHGLFQDERGRGSIINRNGIFLGYKPSNGEQYIDRILG